VLILNQATVARLVKLFAPFYENPSLHCCFYNSPNLVPKANPDQDDRSSGTVQCPISYPSTRPDLRTIIRQCRLVFLLRNITQRISDTYVKRIQTTRIFIIFRFFRLPAQKNATPTGQSFMKFHIGKFTETTCISHIDLSAVM
jgi:hypothetical protein